MGSEPTEAVSTAAASSAEPAASCERAGREGQSTGNSAEALTFDLLQNAAYHADRLAHFARLHRAVSFFTILLGTGGVTAAVAGSQNWGVAIGVAVAVLSSFDLAFDFRSQARTHERLRERVFTLLAELEEADGDPTRVPRVRADLTRMFGEESADMCVVNALAYNAAVQATRRHVDPADLIPLNFWQRAGRHWARWPGEYLTGREREEQARAARGG